MTLVTTVQVGADWTAVNVLADAYLSGIIIADIASISPFISTDGSNVGVFIVTSV